MNYDLPNPEDVVIFFSIFCRKVVHDLSTLSQKAHSYETRSCDIEDECVLIQRQTARARHTHTPKYTPIQIHAYIDKHTDIDTNSDEESDTDTFTGIDSDFDGHAQAYKH